MATKGMRAYSLATELGLGREELIKKAAEIGIEIRNPMASLDEDVVTTIRRRLSATPAAGSGEPRAVAPLDRPAPIVGDQLPAAAAAPAAPSAEQPAAASAVRPVVAP